jgi:hypothetical protein
MIRLITHRLLLAVVLLFVVSAMTFVLTAIAPGDPAATILGTSATPEAVEELREQLGLNEPIVVQYWTWLQGAIRGDFGDSLVSSQNVTEAVADRLPVTLSLVLLATLVTVIVGVALGLISGGIFGNLYDRLALWGHAAVRDWILFEWPESGLSISSDTGDYINPADEHAEDLLSDDEAARRVTSHILHSIRPDTQSERILRSLVNPRHDYRLDDSALLSLFSAANELFFLKKLDRRVAWDWSHSSSEQYARHIVGTTALRRSATQKGYETLIVLSTPILKDTSFNRRLLISTFLHEMIHSYLFVMCGLKAKENGGHTPGFRKIATAIDDWVGKDYLHLRDMEADLERYRGAVNSVHKCSDHAAYPAAVPPVYPAEEDEPYRTRSPASHPNWHWGNREDFGAPRHTRMQQADESTAPAAYTGAATSSPSIATYVPPSYHTYHPQRYADEQQQQQQHYLPPVHRYH